MYALLNALKACDANADDHLARSYSWKIWHFYHRTCRSGNGPGDRQPRSLETQHLFSSTADTKRRFEHEGRSTMLPLRIIHSDQWCIPQVRLFLRRGLSVRYLLPSAVVDYIEEHDLYKDDSMNYSSSTGSDKDRDKGKETHTKNESSFQRAHIQSSC